MKLHKGTCFYVFVSNSESKFLLNNTCRLFAHSGNPRVIISPFLDGMPSANGPVHQAVWFAFQRCQEAQGKQPGRMCRLVIFGPYSPQNSPGSLENSGNCSPKKPSHLYLQGICWRQIARGENEHRKEKEE